MEKKSQQGQSLSEASWDRNPAAHRIFPLPHSLHLICPQLTNGSRLSYHIVNFLLLFHVMKKSYSLNVQVLSCYEMLIPVLTVYRFHCDWILGWSGCLRDFHVFCADFVDQDRSATPGVSLGLS